MSDFKYDISFIELSSVDKFNPLADLLDLLKQHDYDSYRFSINTAAFNLAIAIEYGIKDNSALSNIIISGLLHDIGKLGMSKEFINYPGSYNLSMFNEMKKHPVGGADLLGNFNLHKDIIVAVRLHHLNYDASGYPIVHLIGKEIPLTARITRIADSADAYLSKRCYKQGGPTYNLINDLKQYEATSYDPDLINSFERVHQKVMSNSHNLGEDCPSQQMYMDLLFNHYVKIQFRSIFPSC